MSPKQRIAILDVLEMDDASIEFAKMLLLQLSPLVDVASDPPPAATVARALNSIWKAPTTSSRWVVVCHDCWKDCEQMQMPVSRCLWWNPPKYVRYSFEGNWNSEHFQDALLTRSYAIYDIALYNEPSLE